MVQPPPRLSSRLLPGGVLGKRLSQEMQVVIGFLCDSASGGCHEVRNRHHSETTQTSQLWLRMRECGHQLNFWFKDSSCIRGPPKLKPALTLAGLPHECKQIVKAP
jgi:hypothetical protein